MKKKIYNLFSSDIGIDLGTANTLVYLRGHGIIINEPSVVAVNEKTGRVVAVGAKASQMLGRTPVHITAISPVVDGVVSNFEITEEMLAYLINKTTKISKKIIRPRVVVGVPTGTTNVETRAVYDAAKNAGAREVYIIEEPMAAAIGIKLQVKEPVGSMVIDIGGGTTDIAVISLGGVVNSKSLRVAGNKLNQNIVAYIRDEFKILIGERTAEGLKLAIGSVLKTDTPTESSVCGRDLITGLPRKVIITDSDIKEAIMPSVQLIINAIKEVLEETPPEILSDVMKRGVILVGGGALLYGLDILLEDTLKIPVRTADDPLTAVARGTGFVLENIDSFAETLVETENDLPPR